VLDLVLDAGDRVSRALAPGDSDYYPIRAPAEAYELGAFPAGDDTGRTREPAD
jgi:hypothetical protein